MLLACNRVVVFNSFDVILCMIYVVIMEVIKSSMCSFQGLFVSKGALSVRLEFYLNTMVTGGLDSLVVRYWCFVGFIEGADFSLVSPEAIISGVLLLYEGIVIDVGGEECFVLGGKAIFSDLSKGISEFILAILAGNIAAISRHLCSWVGCTHLTIYL